MDHREQIQKFSEAFFSNLKCLTLWKDKILVVDGVPQDFETFYGKKSPYYLVFDRAYEIENSELMVNGSYLLKAMTEYLDRKGQTTLVRINFNTSPIDEIKNNFNLKNCEIFSLTRKDDNKVILRFTFQTSFQYLNDKEQVVTHIYVSNGNVIDFDLSKYTTAEGKKEDIVIKEVEGYYSLAKKHLKGLMDSKTKEVAESLNTTLEKEITRIKAHYGQQIKEIDASLTKQKKQLADLEVQLPKAELEDYSTIHSKIQKLKEQTSLVEKGLLRDKLQKEEEFFITDEINRHSLSINNKLINTSIIYYPLSKFALFLRNSETGRILELNYNPFTKELDKICCDSCKNEIKDVILCTSGHLTCNSCMGRCDDCRKETCKLCTLKSCELCGKKLCRKCTKRCPICGKTSCSNSMRANFVTGKDNCVSCLKRCPICNQFTDAGHLKQHQKGMICEKCYRLESVKDRTNSFRR